jgi:hypothetical protein
MDILVPIVFVLGMLISLGFVILTMVGAKTKIPEQISLKAKRRRRKTRIKQRRSSNVVEAFPKT